MTRQEINDRFASDMAKSEDILPCEKRDLIEDWSNTQESISSK